MEGKSHEFTLAQKASFGERLIAFVLDYITILIVLFVLIFVFPHHKSILYFLINIIYLLYNIFMDYFFQGTIGKLILKLKVIKINGDRPDIMSAFYRNIGKIVSAIPFYDGFLRILAPHQFQTMHDELGKCFVVKTKNK